MRRAGITVSWLNRLGEVSATKLALVFGFNLTIWVFFIIPLIAEFFPPVVQARVFYYASGWVQLFALPLMVYVSNKIQRESDKQDQRQVELLTEVRAIVSENQRLAQQVADLGEALASNGIDPPDVR
jgi:hypothetical protein